MGLIERKKREKEDMRRLILNAARSLFLEQGYEKTSIRGIAEGKVTAIVGASGSGKTTLLKLLLKFHEPIEDGQFFLGNTNLKNMSSNFWRSACGVVMQDGFIFSDTIARNVSESDPNGVINRNKLQEAVHLAKYTGICRKFTQWLQYENWGKR